MNDAVETWIYSSLHGKGKLISIQRKNYLRPLRITPKKEIVSWAERNKVPFVQDQSNFENDCMRNIIRNEMIDVVKKVNPGIEKTVMKLIQTEMKE